MDFFAINWLAVLVAAVLFMIIGMFWYSPAAFGNQWMKLVGKTKKDIRSANSVPMYIGSFLVALVLSYVLAEFLLVTSSVTLAEAISTAFWAWVGFTATFGLSNMMFQGKPPQLFAIDSGYYLVSMLLMAVILFKMG